MNQPRPNRRWFQISLKTLFVLMLVVAAYFAGLTTAQRLAEKELQKARDEAEANLRQSQAAELKARAAAQSAVNQALQAQAQAIQAALDREALLQQVLEKANRVLEK
jgi:hypothetical protein